MIRIKRLTQCTLCILDTAFPTTSWRLPTFPALQREEVLSHTALFPLAQWFQFCLQESKTFPTELLFRELKTTTPFSHTDYKKEFSTIYWFVSSFESILFLRVHVWEDMSQECTHTVWGGSSELEFLRLVRCLMQAGIQAPVPMPELRLLSTTEPAFLPHCFLSASFCSSTPKHSPVQPSNYNQFHFHAKLA